MSSLSIPTTFASSDEDSNKAKPSISYSQKGKRKQKKKSHSKHKVHKHQETKPVINSVSSSSSSDSESYSSERNRVENIQEPKSSASVSSYKSAAIGKHKKYDGLNAIWDTLARARLRAVFGTAIQDHWNSRAVDFLVLDKKCYFNQLEVQVAKKWREGKPYPYEHLAVFTRKGRYDEKTLFCTLNRELTVCYLFNLREEDKKHTIPCPGSPEERLYCIPQNRSILLYLHIADESTLSKLFPKE
jgi:hypothetical protein